MPSFFTSLIIIKPVFSYPYQLYGCGILRYYDFQSFLSFSFCLCSTWGWWRWTAFVFSCMWGGKGWNKSTTTDWKFRDWHYLEWTYVREAANPHLGSDNPPPNHCNSVVSNYKRLFLGDAKSQCYSKIILRILTNLTEPDMGHFSSI